MLFAQEGEVARLMLCGFLSAMVCGAFIGSVVDKIDHDFWYDAVFSITVPNILLETT